MSLIRRVMVKSVLQKTTIFRLQNHCIRTTSTAQHIRAGLYFSMMVPVNKASHPPQAWRGTNRFQLVPLH
jgi:hypothetical protein